MKELLQSDSTIISRFLIIVSCISQAYPPYHSVIPPLLLPRDAHHFFCCVNHIFSRTCFKNLWSILFYLYNSTCSLFLTASLSLIPFSSIAILTACLEFYSSISFIFAFNSIISSDKSTYKGCVLLATFPAITTFGEYLEGLKGNMIHQFWAQIHNIWRGERRATWEARGNIRRKKKIEAWSPRPGLAVFFSEGAGHHENGPFYDFCEPDSFCA